MPKNDIVYLLKFASKEAYIDDLINGRLYMNTADYYHGLPGEQGDPPERPWPLGYASTDMLACPSTAYTRFARTISSTTP